MGTNAKAKKKIRRAINVLQDSLFTEKLTKDQRTRVKMSLSLLFDAFSEAAGLDPNLTYRDAAGSLNAASSRLKLIKKERKELANGFASAAKILNAVNSVLGLLK